jgi:hypothetical protein
MVFPEPIPGLGTVSKGVFEGGESDLGFAVFASG